jgi:hypothetical protein
MMHVLIEENLHAADYVSRHTLGFEELRKKAAEYTPQLVSLDEMMHIAPSSKNPLLEGINAMLIPKS